CADPGHEGIRRAGRVVDGRLGSERQGSDTVMAQTGPVLGHQPDIAGEDDIAEFGQGQEVLEVRWILLVPEHRRNAQSTADTEQFGDLCTGTGRTRELELPCSVVAIPRRLDEDEVEAVELVRPVRE